MFYIRPLNLHYLLAHLAITAGNCQIWLILLCVSFSISRIGPVAGFQPTESLTRSRSLLNMGDDGDRVGFVPASAIEISLTQVLYNPTIVKFSLYPIVKETKVRLLHFTLPNENKLIAAPYFSLRCINIFCAFLAAFL